MPFRGRSRYPPLRNDTQRDSGAFEWVSCGAHQSQSVKPSLIASGCTKFVQIGGIEFGCRKRGPRRSSERGGMRGL